MADAVVATADDDDDDGAGVVDELGCSCTAFALGVFVAVLDVELSLTSAPRVTSSCTMSV